MDHRKAGDHEAKDCASRIAARRFRSPSQLSLSSRVWESRPPKMRRWDFSSSFGGARLGFIPRGPTRPLVNSYERK